MNRRHFLALAGGAVALPSAGRSQVCPPKPPRVCTHWAKSWPPVDLDTPLPCTDPAFPGMQFDTASAVGFQGTRKPLPRRGWSTLDPHKDRHLIQDVKDGYCMMRSLPQSDPRSLLAQTWLHAYYCGNGWTGGDLHHSWYFLPWHRAYVYFHEQIIGSLLGKPHFRLPYWDWDEQGKVPQFFVDLGLPDFLINSAARLDPGPAADWADRCVIQAWLMADSFTAFVGPENPNGPQGMAANGPHGMAHALVGGAMRNPPTASADPVFYAHHGNVDRFWSYWQHQYPQFGPPDSWGAQEFFFHDGQCRLVRVKASDVADIANLGYTYDRQPGVLLCDLSSMDIYLNDLKADTGLTTRLKHITLGGLLATKHSGAMHFADYLNGKVNLNDLLKKDCLLSFPMRTELTLPAGELQTGKYYVVGLNRDKFYRVGGFGVFATAEHLAMGPTVKLMATGCLDPELFAALLKEPSGFDLMYGESQDGSNPAKSALRQISGDWLVKMLFPKGYVESARELLGTFGGP